MIYAKSTLGEPRLVHCSAEWQDGSIKVKDDTTENGCILMKSDLQTWFRSWRCLSRCRCLSSPGSLRELLSISQAGWDVMNIFPQEQIQTKLLAGTVSSSLWVAMLWRLSTRWAKRKSTGSHFCIIYISDTSRSRKNSDTCRSQPASPEGWCFHYN